MPKLSLVTLIQKYQDKHFKKKEKNKTKPFRSNSAAQFLLFFFGLVRNDCIDLSILLEMGRLPWLPLSAQRHAYTCGSWESCGWRRRGRDAWEKANACESTRRRQLQSSISGYKVIQCLHVVSGLEPRCTFITSGGVGRGGEGRHQAWIGIYKKTIVKPRQSPPSAWVNSHPQNSAGLTGGSHGCWRFSSELGTKKKKKKINDLNEGRLTNWWFK